MESYRALVAYKKKHGHCNVPRRNPGDFALGQWVNKQRSRELTRRQRDKLKALGFDFECKRDKNQRSWDEKFERLKVYKKKHRGKDPIVCKQFLYVVQSAIICSYIQTQASNLTHSVSDDAIEIQM